MTRLNVAALQLAFTDDIDENIKNVSALVREAAAGGAKVVLPPELFEGLYFCRTEDEALFAALAVALGYKRNQTPFLLLAQKVGLRGANEAALFGVAGFLEAPEPPAADREVRGYLRELWESWWKLRAGC